MPTPSGGGRPRPRYHPTDQDRRAVVTMVAGGIVQDAIAAVLGIRATTLRRHFKVEIATAQARANAQVLQGLYRTATSDDAEPRAKIAAQIFWLKCRAGWHEQPQQVENGPGGPFRHSFSWADATPPPAAPDRPNEPPPDAA